MTIEEQVANADGSRFQQKLADFIAENKPQVIVETGSGVSTVFVLHALDKAEIDGKLYSIDPAMWYEHEISHPKFEQIKAKSEDALLDVFLKTGPWDIAISDGNHDIKAQTYEYELMFACLKPGGYLIADDTSWGDHGAWKRFLENHDLKEGMFGDARIIRKPAYLPVFKDMAGYEKQVREHAENAEREFLERGGKNSSVEWVRV